MSDRQTGIGVMINQLFGGSSVKESAAAVEAAFEKEIAALKVDPEAAHGDGALVFTFTDGSGLMLYDDGRSCCEHRWMHTDDALDDFVGAKFMGAEVESGPDEDADGEVKESQFLKVKTSKGVFTVVNYNEHNGYYGGFWLRASVPAKGVDS